MRISFRKKKLESHEIEEVIDIQKKKKTVIFFQTYDSVLKQILVLMFLWQQIDFYWAFKFDIIYNNSDNQLWILCES